MNPCEKYDLCLMKYACPFYLSCVQAEMDDCYDDYQEGAWPEGKDHIPGALPKRSDAR